VAHPTVLIAEDDAELRRLLVTGLREAGFDAEGVGTGTAFLSLLETRTAHALILDIGLPDADGRDVCQAIRARGIETPVLFLSARDAVPDRISGFTSGGDDYVTKPFSFAEVVVRLHALLRRTTGSPSSVLTNGLELDPARHTMRVGERSQTLTPTELRILGALAAREGEIVRRRDLVAAGWPHGARVSENTLDAYVARLRRKLRALPDAPTIHTTHGVGYTLE
jgi:two-component system OmpR family response regulator